MRDFLLLALQTFVGLMSYESATVNAEVRYVPARQADQNEYGISKVVVIGEDSRVLETSKLVGAEASKYSAIGLITCRKENASPDDPEPYISVGTGTLVENSRIVVTALHTFVTGSGELVTPLNNCTFNILDGVGQLVAGKSVRFASILAPLKTSSEDIGRAETLGRGGEKNIQNDWAVVLLETAIKEVAPFKMARNEQIKVGNAIKLCSFSHDLTDNTIKRCIAGTYMNNGMDLAWIRNPNALLYDIDTEGGSSGAPIFRVGDLHPTIFALHKSGKCSSGIKHYEATRCFNLAVIPPKMFYEALDEALATTGGSDGISVD